MNATLNTTENKVSTTINDVKNNLSLVSERLNNVDEKVSKETIISFIQDNEQYLTVPEMAKKLNVDAPKVRYHANKLNCNVAFTEKELLTEIAKHNDYTNGDGIQKEKVRNILANEVKATNLAGKYLGLPFYTATFEKKILKMVPDMTFEGCEIEPYTYLLREKYNRIYDFPMAMHNCSIIDIIRKSEPNTYAHVFLDYMGGLAKFGNEIIETMDRQVVEVGGTLAYTIQNAQRFRDDKTKSLIQAKYGFNRASDDRTESSKMIDRFNAEILGTDYKLISNNYYKDAGHVGMNLVILQRIK